MPRTGALRRVRVTVVAGPPGAGKTALVNALLALKPPGEKWAARVEGVGNQPLHEGPEVAARYLWGCMCGPCGTGTLLSLSAAQLIRMAKPARLILEIAQPHLPAIVGELTGPHLRKSLELDRFFLVVPPEGLAEPGRSQCPLLAADHLELIDHIVVGGPPDASGPDPADSGLAGKVIPWSDAGRYVARPWGRAGTRRGVAQPAEPPT